MEYELPTLTTLHGPAQPMLGVDWGVSFDRSAGVAIARLPVSKLNPDRSPRPTFGVASIEVWPQGHAARRDGQRCVSSPAPWAVVSPEESGVGAGPSQDLLAHLRRRMVDEEKRRLDTWREHHGETRWG